MCIFLFKTSIHNSTDTKCNILIQNQLSLGTWRYMVNLYVSFCRMSSLGGRITCRKWLQLFSPPELGSLTWTLSLVLVDGSTRMSLQSLELLEVHQKRSLSSDLFCSCWRIVWYQVAYPYACHFLTWKAVWREEMQSCDHRLMFKDRYHDGSFFVCVPVFVQWVLKFPTISNHLCWLS